MNDEQNELKDKIENQENARKIQNVSKRAASSANPYARGAGKAMQLADKVSHGKASQKLGEGLTNVRRNAPFLNNKNRRRNASEESEESVENLVNTESEEETSQSESTQQDTNASSSENSSKLGFPKFSFGNKDDDTFPNFKKAGKFIKIFSFSLPFLAHILILVTLLIFVYAQIMTIRDQIATFAENAVIFTERLNNFITGNGWKTSEESFFQKLYLASENYVGEDNLDIPLLAATIHHTVIVDLDAFDGEEGEKNELVASEDTLSDDFSLLGNAVDLYHTKTFYDVASVKLGEITSAKRFFSIGGAGLLGHLIHTGYSVETTNNLWDALKGWASFFSDIVDINATGPGEVYRSNNSDLGKTISDLTSSLGVFKLLFKAADFETKVLSFMDQNQDYLDWKTRNAVYELKDLLELIKGVDDSYLLNSKNSYYADLPTCEKCSKDGLFSIRRTDDVNDISSDISEQELEVQAKKKKGVFPYPSVIQEQDYQAYYRYLVNIYLPITYYYGLEYGKDYTIDDLIRDANEIFDEKYAYNYLVTDDNDRLGGYRDLVESDIEICIDKNMVNNLTVNASTPFGNSSMSFKDFIIRKAYNDYQLSDTDNAEYLKAVFVFLKGEVLASTGFNANSGSYSINYTVSSDFSEVPVSVKDSLGKVYDEVIDLYVFNSETKTFAGQIGKVGCSVGNNDSCLKAGQGKSKAGEGYTWTRIVADSVFEPYGVLNVNSCKFMISKKLSNGTGLQIGTDGFYMRTEKPARDNYWFLRTVDGGKYNTISPFQCVWYMYGRAGEIIGNSATSDEKKQEALAALAKARNNGGNAACWLDSGICDTFGCSTDYTKPRVGAIAVYRFNQSYFRSYWARNGAPNKPYTDSCSVNYGHVVIVEGVNGNQISISDNYLKGSVNSYDNAVFRYRTVDLSYMREYEGNSYTFLGYIYLLG